MPVYEFHCTTCARVVRLRLSYSEYDTAVPTCPRCQQKSLKRRISRIALAKSEDTRLETMMDDSALAGLDEEDPRSIGKFMRKMGNELGEDLGDEFHEVVGRLEKGEPPESIEKSLPDLGDAAGLPD